jgi:cell division protein ZapE
MDTFYEGLPISRKMRVHFHRFMQLVHQQLNDLKGEKNPLEIVADNLHSQARIICFDEFFVKDIGDAMILGTLLDALFRKGVSLVCTSNIAPDLLYQDGLQRQRFLPAIALLNEHTEVVNIDGGTDYRLRSLEQAELYYAPLGDAAERSLQKSFRSLALEDGTHDVELFVNGRSLRAIQRADDVIWFDFKELCDGPRSQNDYIELAREFHAVLISNLPVLTSDTEDQARRFISLIDEFYDRRVKVILSAASSINKIYQGKLLEFEFERTESRLLEMQSHEYLAAEHKA